MENLYLIVGRSMAGKDTVTNLVAKITGLSKVVSCTDAKIRSDQRNGREHWFMTPSEMDLLLESEQILAYTKIGDSRYCVPEKDVGGLTRLYIIDPEGVQSLSSDRFRLVPFYIHVPEEIRRKRGMERQSFNMDERLAAEDAEFSAYEKAGSYIEIDNSQDNPQIAADKIAYMIRQIERGAVILTRRGEEIVNNYLEGLRFRRNMILAAGEDTSDKTGLPVIQDILNDIGRYTAADGSYISGWGITDHIDADPLCLQKGMDFI